MKSKSVSMQDQLNRNSGKGYVITSNYLYYIIGGSCILGGVCIYLLMTMAGFNTGAMLLTKTAFVAVCEVLSLLFLYRTYLHN